MKGRSDDPLHHERMLLPRSYILLIGTRTFITPIVELSLKGKTSSACLYKVDTKSLSYIPLPEEEEEEEEEKKMIKKKKKKKMGRRIDPSWGGPIELFLVPASVPRLV